MYMQVNETNFIDTFKAINRIQNGASGGGNFSLKGLRALFAYLEQAEEDNGREFELDPIALCCQFAQYDDATDALSELQPDYFADLMDEYSLNQLEDVCRDYLRKNPFLIEFDGGVIVDKEW